MAIFHLTSKSHGRSDSAVIRNRASARGIGDGARSIVARAAYRSATKLRDERMGRTWNYRVKEKVRESFILAPPDAPGWTRNREQLWNRVEACAKRKDAQLAREIEVSLPRELGPTEHRKMLVDFFQPLAAAGQICDVCVHEPKSRNDGEEQPHAHALMTISVLNAEGFGKRWDPHAPAFAGRGKVSAADPLLELRKRWAEITNSYLRAAGSSARVSHKTNAEQMSDALAAGDFRGALALCHPPQTKGRDKRRHNPIYADLRPQLEDLVAQLDSLSTSERVQLGRELMKTLNAAVQKPTEKPKENTMPQPTMSDLELNKPKDSMIAKKKKDDDTGAAGLTFSRQPIKNRPAVAESRKKKMIDAPEMQAGDDLSKAERNRAERVKTDLLRKIYSDSASRILVKNSRFVRLLDDERVEISVAGGGKVTDHGDHIICGSRQMDQAREIEMMVAVAKSKRDEDGIGTQTPNPWTLVHVFGTDEFVAAAAYALALEGFQVSARDENQSMIVKRAVVDAQRELVADGVKPTIKVPARVERIEFERLRKIAEPLLEVVLSNRSWCEDTLYKTEKETHADALDRVWQNVRSGLVTYTTMLTPADADEVARIVANTIWDKVQSGEIELADQRQPGREDDRAEAVSEERMG